MPRICAPPARWRDNAGKPVIAVKLGASAEGRAAALAHTGAVAGSMDRVRCARRVRRHLARAHARRHRRGGGIFHPRAAAGRRQSRRHHVLRRAARALARRRGGERPDIPRARAGNAQASRSRARRRHLHRQSAGFRFRRARQQGGLYRVRRGAARRSGDRYPAAARGTAARRAAPSARRPTSMPSTRWPRAAKNRSSTSP